MSTTERRPVRLSGQDKTRNSITAVRKSSGKAAGKKGRIRGIMGKVFGSNKTEKKARLGRMITSENSNPQLSNSENSESCVVGRASKYDPDHLQWNPIFENLFNSAVRENLRSVRAK